MSKWYHVVYNGLGWVNSSISELKILNWYDTNILCISTEYNRLHQWKYNLFNDKKSIKIKKTHLSTSFSRYTQEDAYIHSLTGFDDRDSGKHSESGRLSLWRDTVFVIIVSEQDIALGVGLWSDLNVKNGSCSEQAYQLSSILAADDMSTGIL